MSAAGQPLYGGLVGIDLMLAVVRDSGFSLRSAQVAGKAFRAGLRDLAQWWGGTF